MDHEYTFLGLITLGSGTWADWFSGTMSALAVITALSAYPITKYQRKREQNEREKDLGRSVGWKLLQALNRTGDIDRHIRESLANREPTNPPGMKFPLVRPLGVPEKSLQNLNQSEVDLLLKAKSGDLLGEIEMCFGRYDSIIYGMNEYKGRHEALFELMPSPTSREGMLFTHVLTQEERVRIEPYAAMLEALLDGLIKLVEENMARVNAALIQYDEDMTRFFGKPILKFEINPQVATSEE